MSIGHSFAEYEANVGFGKCSFSRFESQLADLNQFMDCQDKHGDVLNYPVSWQIREPISEGLQRIIQKMPAL